MNDTRSNMDAASTASPEVLYAVEAGIATVTLNRPERMNAISRPMLAQLSTCLLRADADPEVRAVILTATGRAFCAGLDLKELGSTGGNLRGAGAVGEDRPDLGTVEGRPGPWPSISKPVIGAVNGVAVTGGFELALACDFLIASEQARFADTHARIGAKPTIAPAAKIRRPPRLTRQIERPVAVRSPASTERSA